MLHFDIMVNYETIGTVYIRRLNQVRTAEPSEYEYTVELNGEIQKGNVEHLYRDGALVLIAKVLDDAHALVNPDVPRHTKPIMRNGRKE